MEVSKYGSKNIHTAPQKDNAESQTGRVTGSNPHRVNPLNGHLGVLPSAPEDSSKATTTQKVVCVPDSCGFFQLLVGDHRYIAFICSI